MNSSSQSVGNPPLHIACLAPSLAPWAARVAEALKVPVQGAVPEAATVPVLVFAPEGVYLQPADHRMSPLQVDFVGGKLGFRRGRPGPKPALAKAVGVKGGRLPEVWDVTAGLGGDAFVLASLGCHVHLFERHPVVHSLLADGLNRAEDAGEGDLTQMLARMALHWRDGLTALRQCPPDARPAVVYLDPMFPPRGKSAKVKKGMQIFHDLVGPDSDSGALFEAALAAATQRVVVKRPKTAPRLSQAHRPTFELGGKTVRFDVYACARG